ncbi:MAG: hypothetical protein ACM3TT_07885 [Syntrophothermus sp.]
MAQELFQPSLKAGDLAAKSYDINKFLYVAFFGGVLPMVVLGTLNARWLRVDKKLVNIMLGLGVVALLAEIIMWGLILDGYLSLQNRGLRWIFRAAALLLYLGYARILKPKFQQHVLTEGEIKPLLKDAIVWSLVGAIVAVGGGFIVKYVL